VDNQDGSVGGQTRTRGQAKAGPMSKSSEGRVDLTLSNNTLHNTIEQIEGALDPAPGCEPTRTELLKMLGLLVTDLRLVHRTNDGIVRRMK
jgi:hypothetical protein